MPLHVVPWAVALLATFALTWWRGGSPERLAATAFLTAWLLSYFGVAARTLHPQWAIMVVDSLFTLVLLAILVAWRRVWSAVAAGFFLFGLVLHLLMLVQPQQMWLGYLPALVAVSYCTLAAIAAGTLLEAPRCAKAARATPA